MRLPTLTCFVGALLVLLACSSVVLAQPAQNSNPRATLADYVDRLNWDPASRGPLLIVSPEETHPNRISIAAHNKIVSDWNKPTPQAGPDGRFDTNSVAGYFGYQPVAFGSLTVLAPTTMTVLNYRNLPKPNPYLALPMGIKVRLLESTLTPEQSRKLCSDGGIGMSDLTPDQRDIYLAVLPDPFIVEPILDSGRPSRIEDRVTLSPEDRQNVRLSITKELDWSYSRGPAGQTGSGRRDVPEPVGGYRVRDPLIRQRTAVPNGAFGIPLTTVELNLPKKTDLPPNLQMDATPIALGPDTTVGQLVQRIQQKTNVELFCDQRYSSRRLAGQGNGSLVGAGDLLRALAYALTGTWRHVGPAYVLTDNIEGLGVRHAMIADWISKNTLLSDAAQLRADQALTGIRELDRAEWSAEDPMRASSALIAKLEDFQKATTNPLFKSIGPFVPLGELPIALQSFISEDLPKVIERANNPPPPPPGSRSEPPLGPIRTDGVNLKTRLHSAFHVPGIGAVLATEIAEAITYEKNPVQSNAMMRQRPRFIPGPIAWPDSGVPTRALLIAPCNDEEVVRGIQEADRCGFTECWIQVPRGATSLLAIAIPLGAANHLAIRGVVRPFQALAVDSPEALERNILGDANGNYARKKRLQLHELDIPDQTPEETPLADAIGRGAVYADGWRGAAAAERMIDKGNYLRGDIPALQRALGDDLSKIAAIPGLAGLVLRDALPLDYRPSDGVSGRLTQYAGMNTPNTIRDPLLQIGYSPEQRLACLRNCGFDPIDASPLETGDRIITWNNDLFWPINIALPLFRDAGTRNVMEEGDLIRKQEARTTLPWVNARAAWIRWRSDTGMGILHAIADGIHSRNPTIPLAFSEEQRPETDQFWFGSIDPPGAMHAPVPPPAPMVKPLGPLPPGYFYATRPINEPELRNLAFAQSVKAYFGLTIAGESADTDAYDAEAAARLSIGLHVAQDWDGVVVDLTQMPPARAAALLRAMPDGVKPTP